MDNTMKILLGLNGSEVNRTAEIEVKRLSKSKDEKAIFKIKALGYNRLSEMKEWDTAKRNMMTVIEGTVEPSFKSQELAEHFGVLTPEEVVRKVLLPGEIDMIAQKIHGLSGYGVPVIADIKKKSDPTRNTSSQTGSSGNG